MDKASEILAFSHIPKTAGMSLNSILVRYFGCRHMSVSYRGSDVVYRARDLRQDLRIQPFVRSIGGHSLKPFEDFGDIQLRWYTFLRNPVDRFISHYQHEVEKGGKEIAFDDWYRKFQRHNWQVRMIAGEENVSAAKAILSEKFAFVGLQEYFNESLLLMRRRLELINFPVSYSRPVNASKSNSVRASILADWNRYRDDVVEQNCLDIELYEHVVNEVWPEQVTAYGQPQLKKDVESCFQERFTPRRKISFMKNKLAYRAYRNLIYKPFVYFDRKRGSSSNSDP